MQIAEVSEASAVPARSPEVKGKSTNVPVVKWVNVVLVQPSVKRGTGSEPTLWSREKDVYVEFLEEVEVNTGINTTVVRRDKPYLLR